VAITEPTVTETSTTPEPEVSEETATPVVTGAAELDEAVWPGVLNKVKAKYNTLYSILRAAEPHFKPGHVELEVGFAFHKKRLDDTKSKHLVADVVKELTGQEVTVAVKLGKPKAAPASVPEAQAGDEQTHNVSAPSVSERPDDVPGDDFEDDEDYYIKQAEKSAVRPVDVVNDVFGGGEVLDT
jgi:hypothetical protein